MPAKVTLKVVEGQMTDQEFAFEERTTCIVGRSEDCRPRLPNDEHHRTISRHHCLLDINPPDIRVRDFGSRNGTWVNNQMIGKREEGQTPEEAANIQFPEHDLKESDTIKLGKTVFQVGVYVPASCAECSAEIPEAERAQRERSPGVYQCEPCRQKAEAERRKEAPKPKPKCCAKCGRDVSKEVGQREGEFVCAACQADPFEILKVLLELAKSGDKDLLAIDGYEVVKELGRGGMGAVYLAKHKKTKAPVAIKVMLPQVALSQDAKEKFVREMKNIEALKHRNVVESKESGCCNGTFFITMEFCDSGSADGLMEKAGGKLSVKEASEIILQSLDGLEYAHNATIPCVRLADGKITTGKGLVHRDLKPHNIFLHGTGKNRIAKIGDYGLAKSFDNAGLSGQTRTGTAAGTPVFMPRQQVRNFKYSKPDVDVWAMAASLYYMITGRFPRDFARGKDPWSAVLSTDAVPIRQRDSSIPKRLADVIDYVLVDKPEIRVKSAAEFKKLLQEAL